MLTVILRATLSNWEASSLILWTIRRRGPPSGGGRERWASMVLPATKCNWTAAWSFFSAKRPCHTIGYFWRDGILKPCFRLWWTLFNECHVSTIPGKSFHLPSKAAPCQWSDVLNAPALHQTVTAVNLLEVLWVEVLAGRLEDRSAETGLACS